MRSAMAGLAVLFSFACGSSTPELPAAAALDGRSSDPGFQIAPRPGCSDVVLTALRATGSDQIVEAGRHGETFTCGSADAPLALDEAIISGDIARMTALLEVGADPNARWSAHGDRFPLQEAIDLPLLKGKNITPRSDLVRLLLTHRADPNARWCPAGSREAVNSSREKPCASAAGVTPLIAAAKSDQPDTIALLLQAHANVLLESPPGWTPLDHASSDAVMQALLPAMFPASATRNADALKFFNRPLPIFGPPGPWEETALTRAIAAGPVPPVVLPTEKDTTKPRWAKSPAADRVRFLLEIGANPNQRLTWGEVDWTPLSLALSTRDSAVVALLLDHRADPNGRWCARTVGVNREDWRMGACVKELGMTPLMWASYLGDTSDIDLLLKHGAQSRLKDWNGATAGDYAMAKSESK